MGTAVLVASEMVIIYIISRKLEKTVFTLFALVFRSKHVASSILAFLYLPGTVVHEFAHLITAELLRVPTGKISFTPEFIQDEKYKEIKLGSVEIGSSDPIRRYLIGFAPVFVGMVVLMGIIWLALEYLPRVSDPRLQLFVGALSGYILFSISSNMFSSRKDLEGFIFVFPAVLLIGGALYFAGFRITLTGSILTTAQTVSQALVKGLAIVIGVQCGILILASITLQSLLRFFHLRLH